ncbi:hypothetical protein J0J20_24115, partial [Vibrio vulnificus]|nr:hypothetical protein [Vibrio vulnificus]
MLYHGTRLCVSDIWELKEEILSEAHSSPYAVHPGCSKMYRDLRHHCWWVNMKRDVAEIVARCLSCQQIKAKHQAPAG